MTFPTSLYEHSYRSGIYDSVRTKRCRLNCNYRGYIGEQDIEGTKSSYTELTTKARLTVHAPGEIGKVALDHPSFNIPACSPVIRLWRQCAFPHPWSHILHLPRITAI